MPPAHQANADLDALIDEIASGRCREVSALPEVTEAFEVERVEATKKTIWVTGCRSWYLDSNGVPAAWPWSFTRFCEVMAAPNLAHFELRG